MWFCLLLSLMALTGICDPSEAFEMIFGTSDPRILQEIEDNPAAYWEKRRQDLLFGPNKIITHSAFCQEFVADAQKRIHSILAGEQKTPWYHDLHKVDDIILSLLDEDHPLLPTARAASFGALCDHAFDDSGDTFEQLSTPKGFKKSLKTWIKNLTPHTSHEFNNKLRWQITPSGKFSILDALIMRHEGFYLCSAPSRNSDRHQFSVHQEEFTGWHGLIMHDAIAHGRNQYIMEKRIDEAGLSAKEHFDLCCSPTVLVKGNISTLSQQILGNFYEFHELPSHGSSFSKHNTFSLLFPTASVLLDDGLIRIVPPFMQGRYTLKELFTQAPPEPQEFLSSARADCFDYSYFFWRDDLPSYEDVSPRDVHQALLDWRDVFCEVGKDILCAHEMAQSSGLNFT